MKLLVILSRVPWPLEKGDKLRAFHFIRELSANNEIHLFCLNDTHLHPDAKMELAPYCKGIHIFNLRKTGIYWNMIKALLKGKPLQIGYFYSCKAQKQIKDLAASIKPDHVFCQLIRTAEYARKLGIPATLDYQDVFSKGAERMIVSMPWYMKPFLMYESGRVASYETKIFSSFKNKLIISRPDRDAINHPSKEEIVVVPNGVDAEYFKPFEDIKEYDLVFTGNMAYPPNVNSVEFLVNKVLPLVQASNPSVNVLIAGANPSDRVLELRSDYVTVTGYLDDLRPSYTRSRIFIAPMQIGTGLQNKLLEAMVMKLPCITSHLANDALEAKDGHEILVGETPEDYAKLICSLLDDKNRSESLAENGRKFVLENFNWEVQVRRLEALMSGGTERK